MSNLTLVIDDELLRAARIKALQEGTSVNEVARQAIARFAGVAPNAGDTMAQLQALAVRMSRDAAKHAQKGPVWPGREVLYDEAMAERGKPVDYR
jgi:hypothetical protein